MKVLVTGGSGFIGTHTIRRLLAEGHDPVVFDRQGRKSDLEVIIGDTRDASAVTEAVAHVEGVIHLAGVLGTQETIVNPRPAVETNVLGSLNVFQAVAQYELPAVYIAVGNHWMENTYSISKTCAERFAQMFNIERAASIAIVRALNAYGPGQSVAVPFGCSKVRKIIPAFVCRALSGTPIEVYGDGEQVMDMVYVEDVADVLVRALEHGPRYGNTVYEAGTGRDTTVNEIARKVIATVGEGAIEHLPLRPGEPPASVVLGRPHTLYPLFGKMHSLVKLEDGLARTVEWFRENEGVAWNRPS